MVNDDHKSGKGKDAGETLPYAAAMVASSDDAIFGKTLDGTIVSWNPGAERMYGYAADEVIGRDVSLLAPDSLQEEIPLLINKVKHGEPVNHLETTRITKDGRCLDVSLSISPIRDPSGKLIGLSTHARDITGERRARESIRKQQEIFQKIFDHIPAMICFTMPLAACSWSITHGNGRWDGRLRKSRMRTLTRWQRTILMNATARESGNSWARRMVKPPSLKPEARTDACDPSPGPLFACPMRRGLASARMSASASGRRRRKSSY